MASTSASVQIASAVKATLDGYELPQISEEPTILTVKNFMVELCQMAAAVESDKFERTIWTHAPHPQGKGVPHSHK